MSQAQFVPGYAHKNMVRVRGDPMLRKIRRKPSSIFPPTSLVRMPTGDSAEADFADSLSSISGQLGFIPAAVTPANDAQSLGRFCSVTTPVRSLDNWYAAQRKAGEVEDSSNRQTTKRILDFLLATLLLIIVAPAMIAVAVSIRMESPGPVIFRQRRLGLNNREFVIYKFRSMLPHDSDGSDLPQATRIDPRVGRVGRILRSTSLDELPQLFNVMRGEMSLVGPRPHAVPHHHKYKELIDNYTERHRVLPGITGWAQVNGFRGETETLEKMQRRVEYDLMYIDNWSLGLDLKILFRTVRLVFSDRNAF